MPRVGSAPMHPIRLAEYDDQFRAVADALNRLT
jgi:hypothetical protein